MKNLVKVSTVIYNSNTDFRFWQIDEVNGDYLMGWCDISHDVIDREENLSYNIEAVKEKVIEAFNALNDENLLELDLESLESSLSDFAAKISPLCK